MYNGVLLPHVALTTRQCVFWVCGAFEYTFCFILGPTRAETCDHLYLWTLISFKMTDFYFVLILTQTKDAKKKKSYLAQNI